MKKISKLMLAAVASVALAAPAFAWDFSASGSASAALNQTTTKASTDADAIVSGGISSDVGAITLSSTNADGANTSTLSYAVDYADGGLDETLSISGSRKVGEWTGSAGASYNLDRPGCYGTDNGSSTSNAAQACPKAQPAADTTALTLTNGTMTIVLGDASHLSSQNVGSGSNAAGAVGFGGDDDGIGARVGAYHGVSLGYALSDTMSVAVAYQTSGTVADACGSGDAVQDGEATHGISGTGFSFNGTFGTIGVGATICNAATASKVAAASTSTATSTMGVGVSMDLGDIDPWITFGTYSSVGSTSKTGKAEVGTDIGLTYALGTDSVVLSLTSVTGIDTDSAGSAGEAQVASGTELGYNTAVGPMGLSVGYGSTTRNQTGGTEGYSRTDIEVEMSISF
jgi:hypothetical protein